MKTFLFRKMTLYLILVAGLSVFLSSCISEKNESAVEQSQESLDLEQSSAALADHKENRVNEGYTGELPYNEDVTYGTYTDESHTVAKVFEENGVRVEYIHTLDFFNGHPFDGLRITNGSQGKKHIELLSMGLNRNIITDMTGEWNLWAGDVLVEECPAVSKALRLAKNDGIDVTELTCVFQIGERNESEGVEGKTAENSQEIADNGEKKDLLIKVCSVPISLEPSISWLCEVVRGMRAEQQKIFENDSVCIELIGCGKFFNSCSTYMEESEFPIEGILLYENKTQADIPCRLTGIQVNGASVSFFSDGDDLYKSPTVPAGLKRFVKFSVSAEDLENQQVGKITDLKLQFLTDRRQTGWSGEQGSLEGGDWYPVALSSISESEETIDGNSLAYMDESAETGETYEEDGGTNDNEAGKTVADFEEGINVYEDDWIRMGYLAGFFDGYRLSIVNKSSENVDLEVYGSDETTSAGYSLYLEEDRIGAGSRMYSKMILWIDEEPEQISQVSFRIRILRQGGDKLLHESEEWIVLPPNPISEDAVRPTSGKYKSGKDIPVIVNGTTITLGEISLEEFLNLTGASIADEDKGKSVNSKDTENISLVTEKDSVSFNVCVENYGTNETRKAEECPICSLQYTDYGEADDEDPLISIGGISVGDTKEEVISTFGMTEGNIYCDYYFYNYDVSFDIYDSGIVEGVSCSESYYYY